MKVIGGKPVRFASLLLIGLGAALLAAAVLLDGELNLALPLVFLMLSGAFFILAFTSLEKWRWSSLLFIPGSLLLAFGLVFLLNVLTGDWNAWAYAWLLLVAGSGLGVILAAREQPWPPLVSLVGWGMVASGITLFALFGAIARGPFIQIMAPILLILGGALLYWLRPENVLPEPLLRRLHLAAPPVSGDSLPGAVPNQNRLIEPLSTRELDVLRLVDGGLSNQQIAYKLNVAPSTVKSHINSIYSKLEVQTRVQAVNRARDLGLLEK